MKPIRIILSCLLLATGCLSSSAATATQPARPTTVPPDTAYAVAARGANHQVWEKTSYELGPHGEVMPHVHRYTELASGLNYQDTNGNWQAAKEIIESFPGGAVARQGQYQVIFAGDLNSYGAIDMQTPDGKQLRSNILGLMYVDTASGDSVMIATLQDSTGQLISSNQVLYPDAFAGVKADVRYTYKRGGFEQDVILRDQPPKPAVYGFNPATTVLEVVTEFINPPAAAVSEQSSGVAGAMDDTVSWGATKMGRGKAFDLGGSSSNPNSFAPVNKRYVNIQGRQFLIERVRMSDIQPQLTALPLQSSIRRDPPTTASLAAVIPPAPPARTDDRPIKLAATTPPDKGYVLDYVTISSSQNNFTFQGDTTYYVSGAYNLSGTTTIEGGSIIKFGTNDFYTGLTINGPVNCLTGPYRLAIFTSMEDNSIGETISGSTGTPVHSGPYLQLNTPTTLHDLRFCWADYCINSYQYPTATVAVWNSQFVNCNYPFWYCNPDLHNVLFNGCDTVLFAVNLNFQLNAEQITSDCVLTQILYGATVQCYVTNSIVNGSGTVDGSSWVGSASPVFQTVGGGGFYLATNSAFRNAGTMNISPALLADLATKTTYPPIVYSNTTFSVATAFSPQAQRDTDTPDLGYHYDPLDYVFGGCDLYSNLTFTNGTAAGWFVSQGGVYSSGQPYGISLNNGANVTFTGTATQPCRFVRFNAVQESVNGNWGSRGWMGGLMLNGSGAAPVPQLNAQFTQWSAPQGYGGFCRDNWDYGVGRFADCEFFNSSFASYAPSLSWTNCLFDRTGIYFFSQTACGACTLRNCTFNGGILVLCRGDWQPPTTNTIWQVKNTAFDGTCFAGHDSLNGDINYTHFDYNTYNTNNLDWQSNPYPYGTKYGTLETTGAHDLFVGGYNFQTSWLGDFYLPPASPLIDAGSTTADQVGLYHFTTQTNQTVEANSTVDIGYHYVAVGANGIPIDSNGNGTPDYLEDAGGTGLMHISLTAPTNGAYFAEPANISVAATVAGWGVTTNVCFFHEATQMTAFTSAPYQYNWPVVPHNTYLLYAVVTDQDGLSFTSAPISITVTNFCGNY